MNFFQRLLNQWRTSWGALSLSRRFALLALAVAGIVAVGTMAYFGTATDYRLLMQNLSPEDAQAIITKLDAQNIPYRYDQDVGTLKVPNDQRWTKAKASLANDPVLLKGGKGFELFDDAPLGMTPFVQNVNYTRALQAELARSIMELEPVSAARVIIARAEPSPFVRDQKATTASVVLKLKTGAALNRSTAAGIVALVSRSVEGLKPENVTVVDSNGRMLNDPRMHDQDGLSSATMDFRRELENHMSAKAEEMLSRHLGPGRVIVRVSADVNTQRIKERSEQVSPEAKAIIAERTTTSTSTGASGARGAAGATSNISRTSGGGGGGGGTSKEEKTETDYLVSKTVRELEDKMGNVKRITIAALVDLSPDGEAGKPNISIKDAEDIIKQAIGYQQGRDEIKVTDVKLAVTVPPFEPNDDAARLQRVQSYVGLARNIALTVAIVVTVGLAVLLIVRRREPAAGAAPPTTPKEVDRFTEMARKEPDRVAEIIKSMIAAPAR